MWGAQEKKKSGKRQFSGMAGATSKTESSPVVERQRWQSMLSSCGRRRLAQHSIVAGGAAPEQAGLAARPRPAAAPPLLFQVAHVGLVDVARHVLACSWLGRGRVGQGAGEVTALPRVLKARARCCQAHPWQCGTSCCTHNKHCTARTCRTARTISASPSPLPLPPTRKPQDKKPRGENNSKKPAPTSEAGVVEVQDRGVELAAAAHQVRNLLVDHPVGAQHPAHLLLIQPVGHKLGAGGQVHAVDVGVPHGGGGRGQVHLR